MKLPELNETGKQIKQVVDFRGYNHNTSIAEGEFFDMSNLTSSFYPVLASRPPRGTVREFTKLNGLFAKNYLAWVDGTGFYYNGILKGNVADSKKQFVSMGAYILIFPDKKFYNTSTDVFGDLESTFSTTASVTISGCNIDGTPADAATSTYAKIAVAGIGAAFNQYDGVSFSGCTLAVLNSIFVILAIEADYIVIAAAIGANTSQTGITAKRTVPDMDFLTELNNRAWGCSSAKHEIYASKLGDPFNWNCYEDLSTDSYTATIGSDGDFTGVASYLGYILFFKEDRVHKVYGTKPSNFQIFDNLCRGVARGSEKSLVIVNETLYYMSRNGVVAYQGSMPSSISNVFGNETYTNAVAGGIGNKYYVSMKDSTNIYHLFVFDEKLGIWHREDNTQVSYFTFLNGILYFAANSMLMKMDGTDSEVIKWYAEFSDFSDKSMNKKYVSRILLRAELEEESVLEAWIMYNDNGVWERITTITGKEKTLHNLPIRLRRCEIYKLKLSGIGACKVLTMAKIFTEGSDT